MRISFEIAAEGIWRCMQNAQDLINESRLLHEHGHYARSFSLAVLAFEEAGKPDIIFCYARNDCTESAFKKRFHKHKYKQVAAIFNNLAMVRQEMGEQELQKRLVEAAPFSLEEMKQKGLYVEYDNGRFVSPIDNIKSHLAMGTINDVQKYLDRIHSKIPKDKSMLSLELKAFSIADKQAGSELEGTFRTIQEALAKVKKKGK